jgi:hypothetical protein
MLHSYAFANFRSFLTRVEISFALTDKDAVNGWDRVSPQTSQRLTTVMAVMGANASGKTSLIQPLAFLAWFARHSFSLPPDAGVPLAPHFNGANVPSDFEVIADAPEPGTLLRYRLRATLQYVLAESLEHKARRGQWRPIFDRQRTDGGRYKVTQDSFGLDPAQAEKVRANVSLISWAAQFNVPFANQLLDFAISTNMFVGGRWWQPIDSAVHQCIQHYAENPALHQRLVALLGQWDLGLSGVELRQHDTPSPSGENKKQWLAFGVHPDGQDKTHLLPFMQESSGTKTAFALLTQFLPVLERGGIVAYDELDSDLHPHVMEALLDLFAGKDTNPHDAQIIFTCHAAGVLRLLQKSQVMLVEKEGLDSEAWRLDSMEGVRSDENRVAKYLAGAYGAVPRL